MMPKSRGTKNLSLKSVFHIFCEGKKTEPNYFNGYLANFHPGNCMLKVIKIEKTSKNTPVQLVNAAVELKNSPETPAKDLFWVVYDRESKSKYSDSLHQCAIDKAKANEIEIAISNVCFELWILLHFQEVSAPYLSFDNLMKESDFKKKLKTIGVQNYKKADNQIFDLICRCIPDARNRANKMNQETIKSSASHCNENKPYLLNPYTNVHKLLDAIDNFAKENIKK